MEKPEWLDSIPDNEKNLKICLFVLTIHERGRHTHRHADTVTT